MLDPRPEPRPGGSVAIVTGGSGGTGRTLVLELTDPVDVERLFDEAIEVFGVVDVVIDASPEAPRTLLDEAGRRIRGGGDVVSPSVVDAAAVRGPDPRIDGGDGVRTAGGRPGSRPTEAIASTDERP